MSTPSPDSGAPMKDGDRVVVHGFDLVADSSVPDGELRIRGVSRAALAPVVTPLRFGGFLVGTGEGVLDELEREFSGASRAEILEWCVGQLDGEALDDDSVYRFEIDKLEADPNPDTVEFLRRYCTLCPSPSLPPPAND